jgi:RNA 2',3'-cyclic 3'-phosphodiesterase
VSAQERVRLFVALELPDAVRAALCEWRSRAAGSNALRAVPAESLHVTLCFLGSVEIGGVSLIASVLEGPVPAGAGPMPLALGSSLWLPPRRPRVLGVGIVDVSGRLAAVQAAVAGALTAGGWYEPEARPFLAHVTVSRVRRGERVRPASLEPPAPLEFEGGTVTLFRSHPGSRYEPLSSVGCGVVPPALRSARDRELQLGTPDRLSRRKL